MLKRRWFVVGLLAAPLGCSRKYRVGDRVMIEWDKGKVYPGSIVEVVAAGRYKVHFEGYDSIWDETVPATRIRGFAEPNAPHPEPPAKVLRALGNTKKKTKSTFREGDKVRVEWKGTYYPAEIISVLGSERYRVHFIGYDSNWDDNVELSRIKRR